MKVLVVEKEVDNSIFYKLFDKNSIIYETYEVKGKDSLIDCESKLKDIDLILVNLHDNSSDVIKCVSRHKKPIMLLVKEEEYKARSKDVVESILAGVIDFIIVPSVINFTIAETNSILFKIKNAVRANENALVKAKRPILSKKYRFSPTRKKILIIASSTGGPQTLEYILTRLPKNFPSPILVVQHMPPVFTRSLANRLNKLSKIEIREAKEGDELEDGVALVAPGGFHMELISEIEGLEGEIRLSDAPPELGVRPNANILFNSVAKIFKENTVGLVLTGMGKDGLEGCKTIKSVGGTVITESEKSCIIYGMPKEVVNADLADEIVDLEDMPKALIQVCEI